MTSTGRPTRCTLCKARKRTGFDSSTAGGWVCIACYRRELAPRAVCSDCGDVDVVACRVDGRSEDGPPLCSRCYQQRHIGRCVLCTKRRPVHTRDASGRAICDGCYRAHARPFERCTACDKLRVVASRDNGRAFCSLCTAKRRPLERCAECGRDAQIAARPATGALCFACHRRQNVALCVYCKRVRPVNTRTARGRAICGRCAFRRCTPLRACGVCHESKRTRRRTADGAPLCDGCYGRSRVA